ncbi:hypothetical protein [Mesorhizobium sp. B2-8-9]|uniref:hypothetical protein n=1 Tax=Mesorhizobium sp. B2-8-9 TaxID=2589899 RepID=UPI001125FB2C|nr:hypothetical protein [Mesorhizobium sp. B2-8-9]TPI67122.1 hypothetical protein FJ423_32800 [Mesorhizobium sp. B2-8-9]
MTIFSFASDSAESDVRDPNRISASDADQLAFGEDDANHKRSKGTFTPDKVRFLRHVLEGGATANERKCQREARSLRLVANYMTGMSEERELRELSHKPLGR